MISTLVTLALRMYQSRANNMPENRLAIITEADVTKHVVISRIRLAESVTVTSTVMRLPPGMIVPTL